MAGTEARSFQGAMFQGGQKGPLALARSRRAHSKEASGGRGRSVDLSCTSVVSPCRLSFSVVSQT